MTTQFELKVKYNEKMFTLMNIVAEIYDNPKNVRMTDIVIYNLIRGQVAILASFIKEEKVMEEFQDFIKEKNLEQLDKSIYKYIKDFNFNLE